MIRKNLCILKLCLDNHQSTIHQNTVHTDKGGKGFDSEIRKPFETSSSLWWVWLALADMPYVHSPQEIILTL